MVIQPPTALAPGAAPAIPNRQSTIIISDNATGGDANALVAPTNPLEGQVIYISNNDDDPATFEGNTLAAGNGFGHFMYLGGQWNVVSIQPQTSSGCQMYAANSTGSIDVGGFGTFTVVPGMSITQNLRAGDKVMINASVGMFSNGRNNPEGRIYVNGGLLPEAGRTSSSVDFIVAWMIRNALSVHGYYLVPADGSYTFDFRATGSFSSSGVATIGAANGNYRQGTITLLVCP